MIAPALFHSDALRAAFSRRIMDDDSMYFHFDDFVSYAFDIDVNEARRLQYVSVSHGQVMGYLEAKLDRVNVVVDQLLVLRFDSNPLRREPLLDFFAFLHLIFVKRNYRKVVYHVIDDNPSMAMFQKHLVGRLGLAREVGVLVRQRKLRDQRYHDLRIFEILRENFMPCVITHPDLFRTAI